MNTRLEIRRRPRFALILGTAAVAASLALSGCYESATDPSDNVAAVVADDLTIAELMEKVQISDEQAASLGPVLETWRQQRGSGNENAMGALRMLADASDILDHDQMVDLLALLDEKRQAAMQQGQQRGHGQGGPGSVGNRQRQPGSQTGRGGPGGRGGQPGPGAHHGPRDGHGGPNGGLFQELGLDADQQAAVKAAREEMHTAARALFEQLRAGTITKDELHAAMQPLREQMHTAIEAILTADQLAQFTELRNAKVLEHLEKALERVQAHGTEKLALVARILEMDEQQIAAATTLHAEGLTALSAIIESLRSGQTTGQEAKQAAMDLRTQGRDDFRALLSADQQEVFDALQSLHQGRHGRGRRP